MKYMMLIQLLKKFPEGEKGNKFIKIEDRTIKFKNFIGLFFLLNMFLNILKQI